MYFLVQLKRAKLPCRDLVLFYATCIRSILAYAAPVFFYALSKCSQCELQQVQKSALSIINLVPRVLSYPSLRSERDTGRRENLGTRLYQSFGPVCLMTRHLMKLVFRSLFHIGRTYVTKFLTLPSATRITNLTSY